jgi:hypothetical protein
MPTVPQRVNRLKPRMLFSLVCVQAALAGVAHEAAAARVEIVPTVPGGPVSGRYLAGAGERNDLRVTSVLANSFRVEDHGAGVIAGAGCTSLGSTSAECIGNVWGLLFVRVELGDGDDLLRFTAASALKVEGGPGDDTMSGGASFDRIDGGGGRDELHGNGGDDVLADGDGAGRAVDADVLDGGSGGGDWASYESRTRAVTVDLSDSAPDGGRGEGDTLTGIENVHGGSGDDRLIGDAGGNRFDDRGGTNLFRGRGGDDVFRGARAGIVDCGRGDDEVRGVTRRAVLGRDCELLVDREQFIEVTPFPRRTRSGYAFAFPSTGEDPPIGSMAITEAFGPRRTLARGPIRWRHPGATAQLRPTAAGRRVLTNRRVRATVRVLGQQQTLAWGIVLPRRRS